MKTICEIGVYDDDVGEEAFAELAALRPDAMQPEAAFRFLLRTSTADAVVPRVIEVLKSNGLKVPPNPAWAGAPGYVTINYLREFEEDDLNAAEYLQIANSRTMVLEKELQLKRTADTIDNGTSSTYASRYVIDAKILDRSRIVSARDQVVILDEVKPLVLKERFRGLELKRCEPTLDPHNFCGDEAFPIWELHTHLLLPPLSPVCELYELFDPNTDDFSGYAINDTLHMPPQLRYRSEDLRDIPPFDVARTREALGWGLSDHPLVVSQRFRRFCDANKLKLDWVPVRVDPD